MDDETLPAPASSGTSTDALSHPDEKDDEGLPASVEDASGAADAVAAAMPEALAKSSSPAEEQEGTSIAHSSSSYVIVDDIAAASTTAAHVSEKANEEKGEAESASDAHGAVDGGVLPHSHHVDPALAVVDAAATEPDVLQPVAAAAASAAAEETQPSSLTADRYAADAVPPAVAAETESSTRAVEETQPSTAAVTTPASPSKVLMPWEEEDDM
jgi:hypothetical protein